MSAGDITALLHSAGRGTPGAADALLERVYDELRNLAERMVANEPAGVTIQATVLVHEAWLKVAPSSARDSAPQPAATAAMAGPAFERRAHFFGAAAEAMRRILVDEARKRQAQKRGGAMSRVTFVDLPDAGDTRDDQVLSLHHALEHFERDFPDLSRVVKLRYFVGLTIPEAAEALDSSPATVKREWTFARAWLRDRMDRETSTES